MLVVLLNVVNAFSKTKFSSTCELDNCIQIKINNNNNNYNNNINNSIVVIIIIIIIIVVSLTIFAPVLVLCFY